jgi:hypothetical protein
MYNDIYTTHGFISTFFIQTFTASEGLDAREQKELHTPSLPLEIRN